MYMKKSKLNLFFAAAFILSPFTNPFHTGSGHNFFSADIFAYDWPQSPEKFSSFFGQLRGNEINNSLIFDEPSEVKSAEDGRLVLLLAGHSDDTDFFPSTLGNACIIAHQESLLTVYGNLDAESISRSIFENPDIKKGDLLGGSGNSSWREGKSTLEFQVIDTKNNTSINPKVLMPRNVKELPLAVTNVVLQNRNGRFFEAGRQTALPSGMYRVYKNRQALAVPYRTRVSINGALVDEISYDVLRQDGNLLCVSGRKNYPRAALYPNAELQLVGEATFIPGKNALQITLSDFLGKEFTSTYVITNY